MNRFPEQIFQDRNCYLPFLDRLKALFEEMDRTYGAVADQYEFECNGCEDNCCYTRFYHHTFLEILYVKEGMADFTREQRVAVTKRAAEIREKMNAADRQGERARLMCPLNLLGRCTAYGHRPMICRLHGIPHELHRPDGSTIKNPGCDAFFDQCRSRGKTDYIPFDRTPFYRQMAVLENELRKKMGTSEKIKLSIAEMIALFTGKNDETT